MFAIIDPDNNVAGRCHGWKNAIGTAVSTGCRVRLDGPPRIVAMVAA